MKYVQIMSLIAAALLLSGVAAAWWGQRRLEPDFAYAGALLIGAAIAAGGLAAISYAFLRASS